MAGLKLTEGAVEALEVVIDCFNAATAPGAASSFTAPLTLGESGGGFSLGGAAAPASEGTGGAAPAADGGGGGAAAAPAPSAE